MANGIRTGDPRSFNKGRSSKFREGSRVRQTPEEDRRTYRPKRCGNNNKDEDNSPKNLNDKNQQTSSQKFRQLTRNTYLYLTLVPGYGKRNQIVSIKDVVREGSQVQHLKKAGGHISRNIVEITIKMNMPST